jgi:hypothetical protein
MADLGPDIVLAWPKKAWIMVGTTRWVEGLAAWQELPSLWVSGRWKLLLYFYTRSLLWIRRALSLSGDCVPARSPYALRS